MERGIRGDLSYVSLVWRQEAPVSFLEIESRKVSSPFPYGHLNKWAIKKMGVT